MIQYDTGMLSVGDLPEGLREWVVQAELVRVEDPCFDMAILLGVSEPHDPFIAVFASKNDNAAFAWSDAAARDALLLAALRAYEEGWRPEGEK